MTSEQGTAVVVILAVIFSAWNQWRAGNRIEQVIRQQNSDRALLNDTHRQVATLNDSTLAELATAEESRRTDSIPHDDRTAKEQGHLNEFPLDTSPAQGPDPSTAEPPGES